jgi:hypothetical protein
VVPWDKTYGEFESVGETTPVPSKSASLGETWPGDGRRVTCARDQPNT